eukprot:gene25566-1707_t
MSRAETTDPVVASGVDPENNGGADELGESQSQIRVETALTTIPYFLSKAGIGVNTAFYEYFFGQIGGLVLASEADTFHWEFLLMGTAMGGMRAVSILAA